jgi:hypothetical protein
MCATSTELGEVVILWSFTTSAIRVLENSDPGEGNVEDGLPKEDKAKEGNKVYGKQNLEVLTVFEAITI